MPVFIQQENALDLLTQMEGEAWRKQQESRPCGFQAFLDAWRNRESDEPGYIDVNDNRVLAGNGRGTKYYVDVSGEVVFVEGYCYNPEEDIPRAKALGFRIVP